KVYLDTLAPPFFKALIDYAQDSSYSWHCPGHSGGVAFLKSPVGQVFHQFFGENMLRADVCNAVEELGQLWDGGRHFTSQTVNYTLDGERLDIRLDASIMPG
ncbi:hypothetical protein MYF60_26975, partial [Klebsiella pneumoniae]|nr:hypothetical protein [Klebsiella pneumoniae]